jgi:lipopolysaccharide/colanic/teichoic acid biosynthesis glycosyltransferase
MMDWFIQNLIFITIYRSQIHGNDNRFINLLALTNGIWLFDVTFNKKRLIEGYLYLSDRMYLLLKSSLFMIFCASVIFALLHLHFPRFFVFTLYGSVFVAETLILTVLHLVSRSQNFIPKHTQKRKHEFIFGRFILDSILYVAAIFLVYRIKYHTLGIDIGYTLYISGLYTLFVVVSDWMGKYSNRRSPNLYFQLSFHVRSAATVLAIVAVCVVVFSVKWYSRMALFAPIVVVLGLELPVFSMLYLLKIAGNSHDIESMNEVAQSIQLEQSLTDQKTSRKSLASSQSYLREILIQDEDLFRFISANLELGRIHHGEFYCLHVDPSRILPSLEPARLKLLVCQYRVNDIGYLNRFFLDSHALLMKEGYLVGIKDTLESYRAKIDSKYPSYMATVFYLAHFVFFRVMPKMPMFGKIHFILTKGKGRHISKAELLGRLSFCGFKIVKIESVDHQLFFIAKKLKQPFLDTAPSFGMVITLKRVGFEGRLIWIKKLRTMHPYSEYIQDYLFERNRLQSNGKIRDDFRVTGWGRWFRKFWIDELPQVVNWIRGDLTLVGVRALSEHYFSLYPKELRDFRIQFKPGLIPPYYVDLPGSFDEIIESEWKYLKSKQLHPIRTDVSYFFRASYNILFKRVRSR